MAIGDGSLGPSNGPSRHNYVDQYEEMLRAQQTAGLNTTLHQLGSILSRMVEVQERTARVMSSILEHQQRITDEFLTELKMSKVRETYWETRAHELALEAGVSLEPDEAAGQSA